MTIQRSVDLLKDHEVRKLSTSYDAAGLDYIHEVGITLQVNELPDLADDAVMQLSTCLVISHNKLGRTWVFRNN